MKSISTYILEKLHVSKYKNNQHKYSKLPEECYDYKQLSDEIDKKETDFQFIHGNLIVKRYLTQYFLEKDKFYLINMFYLKDYHEILADKLLKIDNWSSLPKHVLKNDNELEKEGFKIYDDIKHENLNIKILRDDNKNLIFYFKASKGFSSEKIEYFIIEQNTFKKI